MKNRALSILLAFALLCGLIPVSGVSVHAYSETDIAYPVEGGNIYFDKTSGFITGCDQSITSADIPELIDGVPVTSIGHNAFSASNFLLQITIPDSVINIYNSAFSGCPRLTNVTFGNAVTDIGKYAFANCHNLTTVDIPNSVKRIGESAFLACNNLTTVKIGNAVTSIDNTAFKDCGSLTDLTLGNSIRMIGSSAFENCKKLRDVTIPDSVEWIGESAFEHCTNLKSIVIGNGVTHIADSAFLYCGLERVTIGASVKYIGNSAFKCNSLLEVIIPNSVEYIADYAFHDCESLKNLMIGDGVTHIGSYAFGDCSSLTSVTMGRNITYIGESAFFRCVKLTSVTIPKNVKHIGEHAFCACSRLTSVYFLGDAPLSGGGSFDEHSVGGCAPIPGLTLYYIDGSEGWTSPEWNGYSTATWEPPHEHNYTAIVTAPTCTEKGFTTHTCTICGDSYIDTYVDALGHDFGDWTQTKAPTCTGKGVEKRVCSRCEASETREMAALGHSYENGVCVRCGEKDPNMQPPVEFADVPENAWYVGAVEYAVRNGLMNGVGDDQFEPEESMTRAMLVTVLWRFEGEPEAGKNTFSDVPNGQWYTDAVAWAAANGVVNGVGNNLFDPEGKITREQMATILYRYAEKKGIDTGKRAELGAFPDAKQVSAYAKDPVQWAVAEKIINGSDGKLLPQGDATRAQVATILMRFIENIVKE